MDMMIDQLLTLESKVYAMLDMEEEKVESFDLKRKDIYKYKKGNNDGSY